MVWHASFKSDVAAAILTSSQLTHSQITDTATSETIYAKLDRIAGSRKDDACMTLARGGGSGTGRVSAPLTVPNDIISPRC